MYIISTHAHSAHYGALMRFLLRRGLNRVHIKTAQECLIVMYTQARTDYNVILLRTNTAR